MTWRLHAVELAQFDVRRAYADIWAILDERLNHAPHAVLRDRAAKGAAARLANDKDGKQAARVEAFKLWQESRGGRTLRKSGAAFARHIVESLPIESTKTVERWMKEWATDVRNIGTELAERDRS